MRRPSNPFTAVGVLAIASTVAGYVAGWQLGWVELLVFASGCGLAVLAALPFVVGRMRVDVVRRLSSDRVVVDSNATATLDVTNTRATAVRSRTVEEFDGRRYEPHRVPRLGPGQTYRIEYPLPTARRGRYRVGPTVIARSDPLRLMRREIRQTDAGTLWVHPRHDPIDALPVGFAKDLEGPTSDTSPIGDVAFHSLREYEPGDDFRHIHWMSTARTGTPMVRHYVDNRRPHLAVLLDDRPESMAPDQFEIAIEITASMAVSSLLHHEPVAVWTTVEPLSGRDAPGGPDDVLDQLSLARQQPGADPIDSATTMLRSEPGASAVAFVTGGVPAEDLLLLVDELRRRVRVIVVRVWPPADLVNDSVPGARMIDVDSLAAFGASWKTLTR